VPVILTHDAPNRVPAAALGVPVILTHDAPNRVPAAAPALHLMQTDVQEMLEEGERRREELSRAWEAAEAASRAKSEFLGVISHELRTPLNGILGLADLLADSALDQEQRRHAEGIDQAARRLMRLVDDVLDFGRMEAGALTIRKRAFPLRSVLEETLDGFQAAAEAKGLRLGVSLEPGLPVRVEGDQERLGQVLANLLDNAVKFTPAGFVTLEAGLAEPEVLRFVVADSGCGIPEDKLEAVFERFERCPTPQIGPQPGTGLGLAVCKYLVQGMGGEIRAQSQPGQGTRVTFLLPLPACPASPWSGPGEKPRRLFPQARVLVVEDDPVSQYVTRKMLERRGVRAVLANDGREALQRLGEASFDLVLMDCQLPELDGYQTTRELRRRGLRVPVVALTAFAMDVDRERAQAAGMDGHVAKPVSDRQLGEVLARFLPGGPSSELN